ncbi:atrial natriuretic peptide receptor 1-like [Paramacrobiotus metropolitanus]|uniref:atrial natriuretic peptide receptor 1-like n=1 Tax=Paramacrobiotus metropolitanus TaxID=2943436 RepID=UPI002445C8EA|nr:atrial natriuretic peptide receptor 1-like [Paramacrobiotus metropolitanus]
MNLAGAAFVLLTRLLLTNGFSLNFVQVIIGDNLLYGYYAAGPFNDVAFDAMTKLYPNVFANATRKVFYKPNIPSCNDAGDYMFGVTGEIYDVISKISGFTILLSSGCSLELMPLGDFAREVNLPLMASTSADLMFANAKRFPTIITFGPLGQGSHSSAARAFVKQYGWRTVTLFCDNYSKFTSAASSLGITCRAFKTTFGSAAEFDLYSEVFDSTLADPHYDAMLLRARQNSRIIIFLANGDEVRKFMLVAYRLNMTGDEYVYINPKPCQGPEFIELQVDRNDGLDDIIAQAYKPLVPINFVNPNYTELAGWINMTTDLARTKYNHTYQQDERENEIALSIPEIMFAIGRVLNESTVPLENLTTATFRQQFLNRTFYTPVRRVRIGPNGMRMSDSILYRLNSTSRKFEPTWYYDFPKAKLSVLNPQLEGDWNGRSTPPLNEPICGFRSDRCATANDGRTIIIAAVCGGCGAVVIIGIAIIIYIKTASLTDSSNWWLLDATLLHGDDYKPGYSVFQTGGSTMQCYYGQDRVWIRTETVAITEAEVLSKKALRSVLMQIRNIPRHDTLGRFYGVARMEQYVGVVWEYGRGPLRCLFANETIIADVILQKTLTYNILTGLQFIHASPLRCHGSLSSLSVIVDNRYTAKICDIGSIRIFQALSRKFLTLDTETSFAPECVTDPSNFLTQESDIYSLGVIMQEILGDAVRNQQTSKTKQLHEAPFIRLISGVIEACLYEKKEARPSVKSIQNRLADYRPRLTVIASLIKRLEEHAENLELIVMARSAELVTEQNKVDNLLAEIIPPSLIKKLRDKVVVPPEAFESVTILFSSMVGFDVFCNTVTPMQVSSFLNELYTFVDSTLHMYDVYKVETVKDGYVVASGVPLRNGERHAYEVVSLAQYILLELERQKKIPLKIRIGIHTGPIAAGIIGVIMPRYCLFGDTMNTASRMESHGEASRIHISDSTKLKLEEIKAASRLKLLPRGQVQVKGKGLVETFWIG